MASAGTAELVARLNRHLFRNTSDDRYATFFYAVYDVAARTLTYTNAGHLAPFFVNGTRVQELSEGGTVVGLIEDCQFTQGTIKVEPGSLFVAFSDGLTEPENVYGEEFGVSSPARRSPPPTQPPSPTNRRKSDSRCRTMGRHRRTSRRHHRSSRPHGLALSEFDPDFVALLRSPPALSRGICILTL